MDQFESRLKSLALHAPSASFGQPQTLDAALDAATRSKQPRLIPMAQMRWKSTAAAILGLAVSAVVAYLVLSAPAGGSIALAKVIDKLAAAKTLSCDLSIKAVDSVGFACDGQMVYDDANNERIHMHVNYLNQNTEVVGVFELNVNKSSVLVPSEKIAIVDLLKVGDPNYLKDSFLDRLNAMRKESVRNLGKKQIEGISCEGFEINRGATLRLWANEKTGDPVRLELDGYPLPQPIAKADIVINHFQLDGKIDPSLFNTMPPEGYAVMKSPIVIDLTAKSPNDLVLMLRVYAKKSGGPFPDRLLDLDDPIFKKLDTADDPNEKTTADNMEIGLIQGAAIPHLRMYITSHQKGTDYQYYPGGKLGEKDRMVFWSKDKNGEYTAVFGDLRVEKVAKDKLPSVKHSKPSQDGQK